MFVKVVPFTLDCHCTAGAGLPLPVAVNEAVLFKQTVASTGLAETVGATFNPITALPEAVPVQFASTMFVTVYVVVEPGLTVRAAGLLPLVCDIPSDHVTTHGPTPVRAA